MAVVPLITKRGYINSNGYLYKVRPLRGTKRQPTYEGRPYCFKTNEWCQDGKICISCRHEKDCAKGRRGKKGKA